MFDILHSRPVFMEKTFPGWSAYPSYPGQVNFPFISLYKTWRTVYMKNKTLIRPLECNGRVIRPAGWTFLHINTLVRPGLSTRSRWDNQSKRESCFRQPEHAWAQLPRLRRCHLIQKTAYKFQIILIQKILLFSCVSVVYIATKMTFSIPKISLPWSI